MIKLDIMNILSINNINKSYGTEQILSDISFTVNKGDRIGIVGANGAGKSTLFRIICGEEEPDSGEISASKDLTLGYLKQREHFPEGHSVYETMISLGDEPAAKSGQLSGQTLAERFEERKGYTFDRAVRGILVSLGFSESSFSQEVGALSGGEKTRLALGAMLLREPDLMLLDEPTNHLDIPTLKWLEAYLKNYRGTLMIISHDRYFLDKCVNRIFEIENTHLKAYEGNYTQYKERKSMQYDCRRPESPFSAAQRSESCTASGRRSKPVTVSDGSRCRSNSPRSPVPLPRSQTFRPRSRRGNDDSTKLSVPGRKSVSSHANR